jgi:eukaryotic-like serine/threonine-protein kinase
MSTNGAGRRVADRYELETELGHGGMGVVWRATDTLLSRQVAVKEVDLPRGVDAAEREAMRARVSREARAAARLSHPGVVTVYDIATDGGRDFIVMELVSAPTLDDLVRAGGPLSPERAARLGLGLLDTLEAAHRAGIVHRDLKPKNVMVRGDSTTKLADFGIASVQGDPRLTATGLVVGSPAYMAPEQVEAEEVGPATDLWALGATLWFAVEGEPPFGGGEFQTLSAIVNGEPRRPQRLGPLGPVLGRLLAKDPAWRPTPAQLRPLLRQVATGAAPAGPGHAGPATTVAGRSGPEGWTVAAGSPGGPPRGERDRDGDTPPVPSRARRRREEDGGTAVLREPAPGRRGRRRRRLPPVPPVPAPGEPIVPGARRRRPRVPLVLAVLAVVLAVLAVWQTGTRDAGNDRRGAPPQTRRPAVPAGWQSFQDADKTYRLSFPPGWAAVDRGLFTDFTEPGGERFFRVQPTTDGMAPMPAQRSLERSFVARHPGDGYRRLRLAPTTFRNLRAAEWEFTFLLDGRATRGYDITFNAGGRRHAILFQAPADRWPASRDELQAFLAGFRPRP